MQSTIDMSSQRLPPTMRSLTKPNIPSKPQSPVMTVSAITSLRPIDRPALPFSRFLDYTQIPGLPQTRGSGYRTTSSYSIFALIPMALIPLKPSFRCGPYSTYFYVSSLIVVYMCLLPYTHKDAYVSSRSHFFRKKFHEAKK